MINDIDIILNEIKNSSDSILKISKDINIKHDRLYSWISNKSRLKADDYQKLINWYKKLNKPKEETFNKLQREIISKFIEYKINLIQSKITGKPMPEQTLSNIINDDGPDPTIESRQYQVEVLINQVAIARLEIIKQQQLIETLQKTLSDKDYIIEMQKKLLL